MTDKGWVMVRARGSMFGVKNGILTNMGFVGHLENDVQRPKGKNERYTSPPCEEYFEGTKNRETRAAFTVGYAIRSACLYGVHSKTKQASSLPCCKNEKRM